VRLSNETIVRLLNKLTPKKCETRLRLRQIRELVTHSVSITQKQSQVSYPLEGETLRLVAQKTALKLRLSSETYCSLGGINV